MELKSADAMERFLKQNETVCLYGAGTVCRYIIEEAAQEDALHKIQKIFVTKITDDVNEVGGIPVIEFQDGAVRAKVPVIIAVSERYQKEIEVLLAEKNVEKIVLLSPGFEKDIREKLAGRHREAENREAENLKGKLVEAIRDGRNEQTETDILFFSPPYWDVYSPFSAVPCLAAKLKEEGYRVGQIDLGIHCIHHVLSKKWKEAAGYCLSKEFFDNRVYPYIANPYESYEQFVDDMWFFQGEEYDFTKVKGRYFELNDVQRGVIDAFYSSIYEMDLVDIDFNQCKDIHRRIKESLTLNYMEVLCGDRILSRLKKLPRVVGISITSTCQFLPGCVLAGIIKEADPAVKIVLGGSCADLFVNSTYKNKEDIRRYFDYVIIGEGETALTCLMQYINGKGKLEEIPNLMLFDGNGQIYYTNQTVEDVLSLPAPDYDGLDLGLYLAPRLILPYQTSRGCHYGQCAFCNHDEKYRHNYRSKQLKKAVEDLLSLSEKYQTDYFQFVDEAIRPDCFEEMVEEMEKHPACRRLKWFYYSRVSWKYNEEILEKARRNGCEMVMFGVETFNQRLLRFIKKGITADTSKYCLELFSRCGIKTYAWLMCNLPSESMEEAREDYEELIRQAGHMDAFWIGPFSLVSNTDMYREPEKYNITYVDKESGVRFMSHHDGVEIDKDEMLRFYREKCLAFQNKWCFIGNRYTLFFKEKKHC